MFRSILAALFVFSFSFSSFGGWTIPSATVISPNGGESWLWNTNHTITWTDNYFDSTAEYQVSLFKQDGSLSGVIGNVTGQTSLEWSTARLNSGQLFFGTGSDYKIKVVRSNFVGEWDQSDSTFSITSQINVLSPNGGEVWTVGNTYRISWSTVGDIPEVQIGLRDTRYDLNIPTGEETIAYRIPNIGYYDFTVPETFGLDGLSKGVLDSDTYQIIVYSWDPNFMGDVSDKTFTIQPASVPEPASLSVLCLTSLFLLRRAKRS